MPAHPPLPGLKAVLSRARQASRPCLARALVMVMVMVMVIVMVMGLGCQRVEDAQQGEKVAREAADSIKTQLPNLP